MTVCMFAELLGFETIGVEIENPFGRDYNDLPLDLVRKTALGLLALRNGSKRTMLAISGLVVHSPGIFCCVQCGTRSIQNEGSGTHHSQALTARAVQITSELFVRLAGILGKLGHSVSAATHRHR